MSELLSPELPTEDADSTLSVRRRGGWATFFRLVPAADSLRTYSLAAGRADLMAGLTVAAVAVPQAMAYALVAGTGPEFGLYTAIVMTAVGALLDSSKQLINGPTNAIAIALLSALAPLPPEQKVGAAITMALLVGLVQTGITLLRLGDLTRYVSHAVIVGFLLGAAALLVLDQLRNLLGLAAAGRAGDPFLAQFWRTMTSGGAINGCTLAVGAGTILCILLLRRLSVWLAIRLPEFLLTIVAAAVVVWLFDLEARQVAVVGSIPQRLPQFELPTLRLDWLNELKWSVLAIALLGLLEAVAMAKAIAAQTGQKLDINQQCLSEGLANLTGSFFQCFPGSGSLTRSAINQQAGAVTQWSGIISALAVAAIVLLFAPLARFIPRAALAGILMVSAWRMIDRQQLIYFLRATRYDAVIVVATALTAVVVSVEFCILIGTFLSFVLYIPRAARLHLVEMTVTPERVLCERTADDPACGRILIFSLEGEMFFGSAGELDRELTAIDGRARAGVRVVVLSMRHIRNPDAVCLAMLDAFLKRLGDRGVVVFLSGVRRGLFKVLNRCGLTIQLDSGKRVFQEEGSFGSSTLDAVRRAYELLGDDLCAACPRRSDTSGSSEPLYYMI